MSGKRAAPYQIDQKTLQQRQVQQPNNSATIQTKNQKIPIQQRKILKIRVPGSQNGHVQSKVNFKFQSNVDLNCQTNKNQNQKEKPQSTNNIFGNLAKPSFNGFGLFSNIQTNNFANLFTSNKNTQNSAKITANSANIFQNNKIPNLFQNNNKNISENKSIFRNQKNQNSQEQQEEDSAQLQRQQQISQDPSKSSVKFQYQENCPIIFSTKCTKFKKNNGDLISNVKVVLQKENQTGTNYISVKLCQTQSNIFAGVILSGRSSVRYINNKQENVEVVAIYQQKQKLSKAVLKFQLITKDQGIQFYQQIQKLLKLSDNKQQKQNNQEKQTKQNKEENEEKQEKTEK